MKLLFFRNIMSSSPNKYTNDQLQEKAKQHATKAVEFDRFNEFVQAYQHYMVYTFAAHKTRFLIEKEMSNKLISLRKHLKHF